MSVPVDLTVWCTGFQGLDDKPKGHTDTEDLAADVEPDGTVHGRLPEGWASIDATDEVLCPACAKRARRKGVL